MSRPFLFAVALLAGVVTAVVAARFHMGTRRSTAPRIALVSIALASGVGGGLAHGSPTVLPLVNTALRAAVAVAFVLAASRSRPPAWLLASAIVAAAAIADPAAARVTGMAAFGIALAATATGRYIESLGGIVGFGVAQTALRLHAPNVVGGPWSTPRPCPGADGAPICG